MATIVFDWNQLNLPEFESADDVKARLDKIHREAMAAHGLPTKVDKNSPGLRKDPQQARTVAVMVALGMSPKEIGLALNIEEKVLGLYYKKELNTSHVIANVMVAQKALEMAMSGRFPDMTKFWLKAQAGWTETSKVELTGKNGGPIEVGSAKSKLAQAMGLDPDATMEADPAGTASA